VRLWQVVALYAVSMKAIAVLLAIPPRGQLGDQIMA
jgi:hypothetical protein